MKGVRFGAYAFGVPEECQQEVKVLGSEQNEIMSNKIKEEMKRRGLSTQNEGTTNTE